MTSENISTEPINSANTKIMGNAAIKVAAIVLLLATALITAVAGLGLIFLLDSDAFSPNANFYDSSLCRRIAYEKIWAYIPGYNFASKSVKRELLENVGNPDWTLHPDNTNLLFVVSEYNEKTGEKTILAQTCNGEPVSGHFQNFHGYIVNASEYENTTPPIDGVSDYGYGQMPVLPMPTGYEQDYTNYYVTVDAYIRNPLTVNDEFSAAKQAFDMLHENRHNFVWIFLLSLVACLLLFVFLMYSAGRRRGHEGITPNLIDKIPLDILSVVAVTAFSFSAYGAYSILDYIFHYFLQWDIIETLWVMPFILLCIGIAIMFCMSVATRIKLKTFWKNTLVYRVLKFALRILKGIGGKLYAIFGYIPFTWKSVLAAAFIGGVNFFFGARIFWYHSAAPFFVLVVIDLLIAAAAVYLTMDMRKLEEAGVRIAEGDLAYKVDTSKMRWNVKNHGEALNRIGEGMQKAVNERMKSERLKTELITNVSHDIKTPLTSIINYIDILKKEGAGSENAGEYIKILERQSARLKKLTEDLVEASKASAGAIPLNSENMDVSELLRQAVGEYDEKLAAAGIEPVITSLPYAMIYADGKLLWRVFDNLLSNIVRYSQISTRAYFTVENNGRTVDITFRNISRDVLNVSADELMERFVRGDSARTDGGSGLGLSIARSLTELIGGEFRITLDGDLFKATISLRAE